MKQKLTREQRRSRSRRTLIALTYLCLFLLFLAWLLPFLATPAGAEPEHGPPVQVIRQDLKPEPLEENENECIEAALLENAVKLENVTVSHYCTCVQCCGKDNGITAKPDPTSKAVQVRSTGRLPGDDIPATERCYLTEEETKTENELIEEALLARSHKIEDVTITFYCCEARPHICGTGTGITASGRRVTPYVSCAVDPDIIPLGSTIMVEYDGEMVYLRADDTGSAIQGNRLDIAVPTHDFALSLGVKTADIWWCEE